MKPVLNIIGAGRLGQSVAALARQSGQYRIGGVFCRSEEHAQAAIAMIGDGQICARLAELPVADFWLLAVPDGAIAAVAAALAELNVVNVGAVVFHASGALEAALLSPLQAQGARLASWHPAFSFADPARAVSTFTGTLCALEGDALACAQLADFTQALGGRAFTLQPGGKIAYHAALSMAANYLVTLSDLALQAASQAGIDPDVANQLVFGLIHQTLNNIEALGPAAALTGPIVRGDAATVAQHLQHLAPPVQPSYRALGLATLVLAGERLSQAQRDALLDALN